MKPTFNRTGPCSGGLVVGLHEWQALPDGDPLAEDFPVPARPPSTLGVPRLRVAARGRPPLGLGQPRNPQSIGRTMHSEVNDFLARKICADLGVPPLSPRSWQRIPNEWWPDRVGETEGACTARVPQISPAPRMDRLEHNS